MNFEELRSTVSAYRTSRIIHAALELRLFDHLEDGYTAAQIASRAASDPRATARLLDALCALGVITKQDEAYYHTALSRDYLTSTGQNSKYQGLLHSAQGWKNWSDLPQIVHTGALPERQRVFDDPDRYRTFILAMDDYQKEQAPAVVNSLNISPDAAILDCGGGPGTYARAFALEYPESQVTLFDLPDAINIARELTEHPDLIEYISGDFFTDDLGGPYDYIFLSNIIHSHSPERNLELIVRLVNVLSRSGRLLIRDRFLDETGTAPLGAVIFGLHMLVNNLEGGTYTVDAVQFWLQSAGLTETGYQVVNEHMELITGRKP